MRKETGSAFLEWLVMDPGEGIGAGRLGRNGKHRGDENSMQVPIHILRGIRGILRVQTGCWRVTPGLWKPQYPLGSTPQRLIT